MSPVTTGTTPQRAQTWKRADPVPNWYFDTAEGSATSTRSSLAGFDVHTPPWLVQNVQPHARAGMRSGSGSQVSVKAMLPQWQLPRISMPLLYRGRASASSCRNQGRYFLAVSLV